ncbi:sensor histidine kinase [Hydrogenophaga sp.]|uniref:sensor histidine kinase n=1 Tax=Hydrogenophaga sp. TaxID=1904254 RepID=UPI003F71FC3E
MRLRTSLLLLCAGTALPLIIASAVAALYVFHQERETLIAAALARNRAAIEAVDAELRGTINLLNSLATREGLLAGDGAKFHEMAQGVLASQPQLQNLVLTALDGRQLSNARLPWGTPLLQNVVDHASFAAVIASGQPSVGDLSFAPKLGNEAGVAVRVAVMNGGAVAAVITAVVRPSIFQNTLERQGIPPGWVTGLVGTDGRFIARVPSVQLGSHASPSYLQATQKAHEGWYRGVTVDGYDSYSAFTKSTLTGWSIGYGIPAQSVTAGPNRTMLLLLWGLSASFFLAAALGYWLLLRIARPIGILAKAAPRLREGHQPPPTNKAIRELAALALALDETAKSIREKDAELLRHREELAAHADVLSKLDAAKTRFLAQVSHELRGPLGTVRNGIELLDMAPDAAQQRKVRLMMRRQVDLLTRLVGDFIDIGRIERGQLDLSLASMDLQSILQDCLDVAKVDADAKNQMLLVTYAVGSLEIKGDADRLTQVLCNLLSNAVKYTQVGGLIALRLLREGDEAVVEVQDNGQGFSEVDGDRMFEMFVRLDGLNGPVHGSLGIGLAVTKAIVQMHGGSITASSDGRGKGALFVVRLPIEAKVDATAARSSYEAPTEQVRSPSA